MLQLWRANPAAAADLSQLPVEGARRGCTRVQVDREE
jgi:hypothetical protein